MKVNKDYFLRYSGPKLSSKIKPYFQNFHKLSMEGDYEYPAHIHTNYELIIVVESAYFCELNGAELTLKPGEFLIVKPGDFHQDHLYNGQVHYVLHFSLKSESIGKLSDIKLYNDKVKPEKQLGLHDTKLSLDILEGLAYETAVSDIYSGHVQDALLEVYFWKIIRSIPRQVLSDHFIIITKRREFQQKLYSIFSRYYETGLTVEQIAKYMGMSKRSLCYYCNDYLETTPAKAMTVYRINRALEYLSASNLSVQEISDKLGFENPFHFSKVFKRVLGKSPVKYRESL